MTEARRTMMPDVSGRVRLLLRGSRWRAWRARAEARFWRWLAGKVTPYIPRGIHVKSDEPINGMEISGMTAYGSEPGPAITVGMEGDDQPGVEQR